MWCDQQAGLIKRTSPVWPLESRHSFEFEKEIVNLQTCYKNLAEEQDQLQKGWTKRQNLTTHFDLFCRYRVLMPEILEKNHCACFTRFSTRYYIYWAKEQWGQQSGVSEESAEGSSIAKGKHTGALIWASRFSSTVPTKCKRPTCMKIKC